MEDLCSSGGHRTSFGPKDKPLPKDSCSGATSFLVAWGKPQICQTINLKYKDTQMILLGKVSIAIS